MQNSILKDELLKLDKRQLKQFYNVLVHYWVKNKSFISKQDFFNLWCELNKFCSEADEGFPEPHDDHAKSCPILVTPWTVAHQAPL